jgi:hypothetical protein
MAKHNLRKIPQTILDRIRAFDQDDVVVACVKLLKPEEVSNYAGLGLLFNGQDLVPPQPAVPTAEAGRFSKANVEGEYVTRKDLPKIMKSISIESPNWGDSSYGTHTVTFDRLVYQRDFLRPKEVELSIELLEIRGDKFVVKFSIDQVINRRTADFENELFYNLNLLQENVGACDVFTSAATLAEFTRTVHVDWQLLPPGTVDEVVKRLLQGRRRPTPEQEKVMKERIAVMSRMKPEAYVTGADSFLRYFGAMFSDDFVVFENVRYGNALYVMHDSWQVLSKKSRLELLAGPRESFERIEHRDGWAERLKNLLARHRAAKK